MYYTILLNGISLGVVGHDSVRNMNLSVQVVGDDQDIFASAVCEEGGKLYLYEWLQLPIKAHDNVEFRRIDSGPSMAPQHKRLMEKSGASDGSQPPNQRLERP